MGGGASKGKAAIDLAEEKAAREVAAAREAAAAQENRVDELQSQLEGERSRSAGLEIQLKELEAGAFPLRFRAPRGRGHAPVAQLSGLFVFGTMHLADRRPPSVFAQASRRR